MRISPQINLTDEERKVLQTWSRGRSTPTRLVVRAKIVLAAADGKQNQEIAADLKMTTHPSRYIPQRGATDRRLA